MADGTECEDASHRSRESLAERIRGELQRDPPSRVSQPRALPQHAGSPDQDGSMAKSLQYDAPAQRARFLDTNGVS